MRRGLLLLVLSFAPCLCARDLNSGIQGQPLSGRTIVYGTVVDRESGQDARVPSAVLSFRASNGATTSTRTDKYGDYSVDLPSGERYSLTVTKTLFCPARRPPFDAQSERRVNFDIVLTTACPRDVFVSNSDGSSPSSAEITSSVTEFCANAGVYYCEQEVKIDGRGPVAILIGFVSRRIEDGRTLYGSSLRESAVGERRTKPLENFSVFVAFGTYTIHAKNVILDLPMKTLNLRGNVSITHDDQQISVGSPCLNIRFGDQEPAVESCD